MDKRLERERRRRDRRKEDQGLAAKNRRRVFLLGGLAIWILAGTVPVFMSWLKLEPGSPTFWVFTMIVVGLVILILVLLFIAARIARKG